MSREEGVLPVLRNAASRRGERFAAIAMAFGGGIALGGGFAFVGAPVMVFAALASAVFANSERAGLRSEGDELLIDTSITTSRAPWSEVGRVVVGANPGLVYFKHNRSWRYLRLAVMGEPLARPRKLREALVDLVRDTSFIGMIEMGGATVPGPLATLRMNTVDLVRWPLRFVMPRPATWWWALVAAATGGASALVTWALLRGMYGEPEVCWQMFRSARLHCTTSWHPLRADRIDWRWITTDGRSL